jgi:hypothetical protein
MAASLSRTDIRTHRKGRMVQIPTSNSTGSSSVRIASRISTSVAQINPRSYRHRAAVSPPWRPAGDPGRAAGRRGGDPVHGDLAWRAHWREGDMISNSLTFSAQGIRILLQAPAFRPG